MKSILRHILPVLALLFCLFSCGEGRPAIPRDDMARIYADFFLLDQWVERHGEYRQVRDTVRVYAPVLERYGYTAEEFTSSMAYYLRDPERYSLMLKSAEKALQSHYDDVKAVLDYRTWLRDQFRAIDLNYSAKQARFMLPLLLVDSLGLYTPDTLLWNQIYRSRYDSLKVYDPQRDTSVLAEDAASEQELTPSTVPDRTIRAEKHLSADKIKLP